MEVSKTAMSTRAIQIGGQSLAGVYGDVFWTLEPVTVYVAGTQIYARIYVGNPTDIDREYLLMATVIRGSTVISEFPIKVDDGTWFWVTAGNVVTLPGAFEVAYTDAILTLNLYERVENDIVDSVLTALTSTGTGGLPFPPVPPGVDDMLSMMITMMIVVMMMQMMSKAMKGEEEPK